MAGTKRKRATASSPVSNNGNLVVLEDVSPSSPHIASTLTPDQARTAINDELHYTQQKIDALLSRLTSCPVPTNGHSVNRILAETSAPRQPQFPSPHLTSEDTAKSSPPKRRCAQCSVLTSRIAELEAASKKHEEERKAWKEFKTWWLKSLSKKDRKKKTRLAVSACDEDQAGGRETPKSVACGSMSENTSKFKDIAKTLDDTTRQVWEKAGMLHEPGAVSAPDGTDGDLQQPSRLGDTTNGDLATHNESNMESEIALQLTSKPTIAQQIQLAGSPRPRHEPAGLSPTKDGAKKTISNTSTSELSSPPPSSSLSSSSGQQPISDSRPLGSVARPTAVKSPKSQLKAFGANSTRTPPGRRAGVLPSTTAHQHTNNNSGCRTPQYIDATPVRNVHQRRSMLAHDCPDCELFYDHFEDRTGNEGQGRIERQACSRHRTTFQRATTPEGYWNIGFPTTQEAEQINQDVARQRRQRDRPR